MSSAPVPRLARSIGQAPAAREVRILHLGLGSFFRAHQAWYTEHAPDASAWGIAAFTGRTAVLSDALAPQDGLYTLITRGEEADAFEVVGSVSRVHPASDHEGWLGYARSPRLAVISLTVTEAGYPRGPDGALDRDDPRVAADIQVLRTEPTARVGTAPARLLAALVARDRAGLPPVAVMPCDNLPDNGAVTARIVRDLAQTVDPGLVEVVDNSSFVTTMVDRITPGTTASDRDLVRARTTWVDAAPVVTEPFSEWVISGEFPAGRPAWDRSGATLTDDLAAFEQRKLWLLNGAHSLLAYAGPLRGHTTVADAIADPVCRGWALEWWDEAARHLTLPEPEVERYRAALVERFSNPRIRHLLAQIAVDGSQKIPVRVLPVLRAEKAAGREATAATRTLAAWIRHLRGEGAPVTDRDEVVAAAAGRLDAAVPRVLALLDGPLGDDSAVVGAVLHHLERP